MLQLINISSINPKAGGVEPAPILVASRRNNARDRDTGLLYSDGLRFLQVFEGPEDKVDRRSSASRATPGTVRSLCRRAAPRIAASSATGRWRTVRRARTRMRLSRASARSSHVRRMMSAQRPREFVQARRPA